MKKIFILIVPVFLWAINFSNIARGIDNNLLIKSKEAKTKALKEMLKVAVSKNYPNINLSLNAVRLQETPTAIFYVPPLPPVNSVVGTKSNFTGALSFTYPVFSGFAISNSINKAKLQVIKSELETDNLKRILYLNALKLYSAIYALNKVIKANKDAMQSVDISLKTALGFYKNNLLNLAGVYNIKAKKYDIKASIAKLENQRDTLSNKLFYLANMKIDNNIVLNKINIPTNMNYVMDLALKNRKDIKIIQEQLKINDTDVKLSKSSYFPKVAIIGALKRQGDSLRLNGNEHTNANENYIGINLKWNIFDGFAKSHRKEAAIRQKEATILYFNNYKNLVKTNIKNSFLALHALKFELISSQEQLKAQNEYYLLTKGEFDNSLTSADKLSRAISKKAMAKAKVEEVKADIFEQKFKIALQAGLVYFDQIIK